MSIWGSRPLENDDAADWLSEFVDAPTVARLRSALRLRKGYIDVDRGAEVVIAAEILAQLRGHAGKPRAILTKEQFALVAPRFAKVSIEQWQTLTSAALAAVARVADGKQSELQQLLSERKAWLTRWTAAMRDLAKRLARPMRAPASRRAPPPMPPKRVRYRVGQIVAIKLPDSRFAYGKVFRDFDMGVYDLLTDDMVPVDQVVEHKILFHYAVTSRAITNGAFVVIGEQPFADEQSAWAPPQVMGVSVDDQRDGNLNIYHKGEMRCASPAAALGLDIGAFCQRPELFVTIVVDRLVDGNNAKYKYRG